MLRNLNDERKKEELLQAITLFDTLPDEKKKEALNLLRELAKA